MILGAGLPEGKATARQFSLLNDEPVTEDRDDTLGSCQPAALGALGVCAYFDALRLLLLSAPARS
ncbi:hypothetical protein [Streptacidiphilus neutrinimicus]|uniref:hypothetical protein n=1 Tax=Streptacidiphilus neutrinimicus TaxID=105420 RepID=UPI001269E27B|nr:hypothetical protein [Streptacidiphilus neutrinimicus]